MALSQEWIFKKEFLEDENSSRFNHTTDVKKEKENRFKTIWFMKDLSNILRPGPSKDSQKDRKEEEAEYDIRNLKVFWTACTFFHRFYVFHSFDSHARFAVAVACLFLASKVEEKPLRLSDHIFLYFRLRKNKVLKKTDQEFKDMERDVLLAERILLQTLSFDLNVVHPYQFFRQIIGKDLKSWFGEADDSKQVLRLATTLLSDSFRSTLCLQYPEQQLSLALVFMSLCISGLQPVPPTSGSQGYARSSSGAGNSAAGAGTGTKWLDLFEKDVDEHVLQSICLTLVEMYETPNSFAPADIPYPSHASLRHAISTGIAAVTDARRAKGTGSGGIGGSDVGYGNTTPPLGIDTGMEEHKGGSPDYEHTDHMSSASNKRKQLSPVATSGTSNSGSDGFAGPVGSTSKYRHVTLPPAFNDTTTSNNNNTSVGLSLPTPSSPCYDAPTPRSTYRHKPSYRHPSGNTNTNTNINTNTNTTTDDARLVSSVASPSADDADEESWVPPPPESPMDSAHSTFSQMVAAQNSKAKGNFNGQDGLDTPLGSVTDTPTYMPPPPDTPGSMASTPNFANLPQPGHHLQHLQDGVLLSNKKARTDY